MEIGCFLSLQRRSAVTQAQVQPMPALITHTCKAMSDKLAIQYQEMVEMLVVTGAARVVERKC